MTMTFSVPAEMKLTYLERKVDELAQCLRDLEHENFDSIKTLAHQMKGNASTFGFPLLATLAESLERAALDSNKLQVKVYLEDAEMAVKGHLRGLQKKPT